MNRGEPPRTDSFATSIRRSGNGVADRDDIDATSSMSGVGKLVQLADGHPLMYTVEEAAGALRIGRTLAYTLARHYETSGGRDGLPVVRLRGTACASHRRCWNSPATAGSSPCPSWITVAGERYPARPVPEASPDRRAHRRSHSEVSDPPAHVSASEGQSRRPSSSHPSAPSGRAARPAPVRLTFPCSSSVARQRDGTTRAPV